MASVLLIVSLITITVIGNAMGGAEMGEMMGKMGGPGGGLPGLPGAARPPRVLVIGLGDAGVPQAGEQPGGVRGIGGISVRIEQRRPQVDGIFSNLSPEQARDAAGNGLRVQVAIDNRYESSPSILKIIVMVLATLSVLVAVVALAATLTPVAAADPLSQDDIDQAKANEATTSSSIADLEAQIAQLSVDSDNAQVAAETDLDRRLLRRGGVIPSILDEQLVR